MAAPTLRPLPPPALQWFDPRTGKPTDVFRDWAVSVDAILRGLGVAVSITTTGNVIAGFGGADQVGLQTHKHAGVQVGGGSTAPPTAGT